MQPVPRPAKVESSQNSLIPRRKILLVDLEARDRERNAQCLRERGFAVCACASYEEGARSLKGEHYDMVIVDQGGPAFEGRVIAERSALKDRKVPVLVTARYHDLACYVEAMQLGAVDYLEKPISREDLLLTIETHMPHGYWSTAKLAS